MTAAITNKQALRERALAARRSLSAKQRTDASLAIQDRLIGHLASHDAITNILLYRALADEVDTSRLFLQLGQTMYAPITHVSGSMQWHKVTTDTQWKKGNYGVNEPEGGCPWTPVSGTSVLICPMAGFDRQGNRLGLGLGCFDRWLANFGCHLHSIAGLAFGCQEVSHIPCDKHDVPMHAIITETEIIQCRT